MSSKDYSPRIIFEITEEQAARANKLLSTFGLRRPLFSIILDDLLDLIDEHGQVVVGILLNESAKPREIIPCMAKASKGVKK